MREFVTITFYDISKCGFYKRGEEKSALGSPEIVLTDLLKWVKQEDFPLCKTCTYEPDEEDGISKTYCFDILKNEKSNDFLIVTWNESPLIQGQVKSVNGGASVGDAEVRSAQVPKNWITGYPTYFWFLPSQNVFASIRLEGVSINGRKNLDKYLQCFLTFGTRFSVDGGTNGKEVKIAGYTGDEESQGHLYPKFQSKLRRNKAALEYLKSSVGSIRRIERKSTLKPGIVDEEELWQRLLKGAFIKKQKELIRKIPITYYINYSPSEEELSEIIAEWVNESHEEKFDDIGFFMTGGGSTPFWISSSVAKDEFEVDIEKKEDGTILADSLLKALISQKSSILRLLADEKKDVSLTLSGSAV